MSVLTLPVSCETLKIMKLNQLTCYNWHAKHLEDS